MSKPNILIALDTNVITEEKSYGRDFIRSLSEDPRLRPELVATSERYKDPFVGEDDFVDKWWAKRAQMYVDGKKSGSFFWGPHWKRRSRSISRGYVDHGTFDKNYQRLNSRIWFDSRWDKDIDFNRLFEAWVRIFRANIALLHLFVGPELHQERRGEYTEFQLGSFGGKFRPGIANMGWAMAYGEGHASDVDPVKIKAAGFPVDEVDGIFIVRVTQKLSDVIDDFPEFSRRRAKLKTLFRPDMFKIKDEPEEMQTPGRA